MSASVDAAQLVQVVGDAIVVADPKNIITLWNAGAEKMFGFSASEAVGQPLDIIIPERLRHRHNEGYENHGHRRDEVRQRFAQGACYP